jgi:3-dehydroquinate synthase
VLVDLGPRSYEIQVVTAGEPHFPGFVRTALALSWAGRSCRRALVVTDAHIAGLSLPERFQAGLSAAGLDVATLVLPPGERTKSLECASQVYDELVSLQADRHVLVVALGGGVIGDLAGFAAATYARGVPLLMIPTTLLAQVDSAVGGKVAVNHPGAKNIIGAFHQPIGVWIETQTLETLPDRELRCGLAEAVKYGVILDAAFFAELERDAERILQRQPDALERIIVKSCQLKAAVVSDDEREESGRRAMLNFGHTFGHAIETAAQYTDRYQHGEAVAAGMVAETRLAARLGWINGEVVDRLARLLARFGLPTSAPGLLRDRLLAALKRDKKSQEGKPRFVLPRAIGKVELTDAPTESDVIALLDSL